MKSKAITDYIDVAVHHGHRKLAAYFMARQADKDNLRSHGVNFLHEEVAYPIEL